MIAALRSDDYRQALSSIEIAMPETTIDSVFDDLVQQHPILDAIGFINTNGKVKMIVNKGGIQLAVWGPLTGAFKTELEGSIDEIDTGMYKLQAFIPVSKAMLDLGPAWLDKYVRTILSEALAFGMEKAIICGTGKDEPVGINRVVGKMPLSLQECIPKRKLSRCLTSPLRPTESFAQSWQQTVNRVWIELSVTLSWWSIPWIISR